MTSKERVRAAIRRQEVDYVPLPQHIWNIGIAMQWLDDVVKVRALHKLGIDPCLFRVIGYGENEDIPKRVWKNGIADGKWPVLHKEWDTPSGKLLVSVKQTEDWPHGNDIAWSSDHNSPRFVKPLIENLEDVERFKHILPEINSEAGEAVRSELRELVAIGRSEDATVQAWVGSVMDEVMHTIGFAQAALMSIDAPEIILRLIEILSEHFLAWQRLACEEGVDLIISRGWYASSDFWGPSDFSRFAAPALKQEIIQAHSFNIPLVYLMCTGVMPLIPELKKLDFDCLKGVEPVLTGQDMTRLVAELGATKSFWTGLSCPEDLTRASPERTIVAVEKAFHVFGKRGFLLEAVPSLQSFTEKGFANFKIMIDTWKKLR